MATLGRPLNTITHPMIPQIYSSAVQSSLQYALTYPIFFMSFFLTPPPPSPPSSLPPRLCVCLPSCPLPPLLPSFRSFLSLIPTVLSPTAILESYVTLRLLRPACEVPANWCAEPLLVAAGRAVSLLHSLTVPSPKTEGRPLSAPAFAYCFPLLRCVLQAGGKAVGGDEELRQQALHVLAEHCKLRGSDDDTEDDEDQVSGRPGRGGA